ncbi:MAG: DUF624 domain-containing protein [Acholeplasmatales bacterium]
MKIKEAIKKTTDILYASFLFLLTTFLTLGLAFGASLTALMRVSFQSCNEKEPNYVFKLYFKSFKESFKEATILFVILLVVGISLAFSWHYALNKDISWLIVILIVASYEWLVIFIFGFSIISLFKSKNIFYLFKNIFLLANGSILLNIILLGSILVIIYLVFVWSFFIVLTPMLYALLVSFQLNKRFSPFIKQFKLNESNINFT